MGSHCRVIYPDCGDVTLFLRLRIWENSFDAVSPFMGVIDAGCINRRRFPGCGDSVMSFLS